MLDLQVDDRLGLDRGRLARAQVLVDDLLEVVDCVQVGIVEIGYVGGDVARHGDVDEEHRPPAARAQGILDHQARDDRFAARRR